MGHRPAFPRKVLAGAAPDLRDCPECSQTAGQAVRISCSLIGAPVVQGVVEDPRREARPNFSRQPLFRNDILADLPPPRASRQIYERSLWPRQQLWGSGNLAHCNAEVRSQAHSIRDQPCLNGSDGDPEEKQRGTDREQVTNQLWSTLRIRIKVAEDKSSRVSGCVVVPAECPV